MSDSNNFDLQAFLPYLLNQAAEESSLSFQRVYQERYGMLRGEWELKLMGLPASVIPTTAAKKRCN